MPASARRLMLASCTSPASSPNASGELAGRSVRGASGPAGSSSSFALSIERAMKEAIWSRRTFVDGEYVVGVVPCVMPANAMQRTLSKCTSEAGRSVKGLSGGVFAQNALVSTAVGVGAAADAVLVSAATGKKPTANAPAVSAAPRRLTRLKGLLLIHALLTKFRGGCGRSRGPADDSRRWARRRPRASFRFGPSFVPPTSAVVSLLPSRGPHW